MSGHNHSQNRTRKGWTVLSWVVAVSLLLSACGGAARPQTFTIGVIHSNAALDQVLAGFKAGMTEQGYVEGKNVTYIFHGVTRNDSQATGEEAKSVAALKVDLLFTLGTIATVSAKKAVEGTKIPVVFAPVVNPVGEGVVASLRHPGGNVTGVQRGAVVPKALEWLIQVAPGTQQVYLFYNPADMVSVTAIQPLPQAAVALGVEFVPTTVSSLEQAIAIIRTLPREAAIFYIPAPTLDADMQDIFAAAAERGIAVGTYDANSPALGALVGYGTTWESIGRQAARMADQILKGAKPADLPVETDEPLLAINLKTAQAIGLDIPDEILEQADTIIR